VLIAAGIGVYRYRSAPGGQLEESSTASAPVMPAQGASASAPAVADAAASRASLAPPAPAARAVPAPPPTLAVVAPLLARLPCSALAATIDNRTIQVRGFVPQRDGVAKLKETIGALPGVDALYTDVRPVDADKCEVIDAYAPYWTRNWQAGHVAGIQTRASGGQLTEGDPLIVDVTTPGYDSYVYVDYYVLDGSVVHMVPGPRAKANQAPPHYTATIGGSGDWIVSKPFGTELVVLLVSPVPLFDGLRPESEPRADYLRALDTRLKQVAAKYGAQHIVADIAPITSKAR
jgi:hypothetical protein